MMEWGRDTRAEAFQREIHDAGGKPPIVNKSGLAPLARHSGKASWLRSLVRSQEVD